MSFEYIPGDSFFHKLDPRSKLIYFFAVILIILNFTDPIITFIILVTIIVITIKSGVPSKNITGFLKKLSTVCFVYALFNVLFLPYGAKPGPVIHTIYTFRYGGFEIILTVEGLAWALAMLFRFLTILITVKQILMLTSIKELLIGLVKWKLPPEFGVALSIGFAYIPVLEREVATIVEAQEARGLKHDYRNPIKRTRALIPILIPSILASFRRSTQIALAIEARGFSYDIRNRTYVQELEFSKRDYIFMAFMVFLVACSFVFGIWGLNYGNYLLTVDLVVRYSPIIAEYINKIIQMLPIKF